ncbi:MAG: bifunctional 4-hydroxy-2-oxoglutarate aldolase/2-dehydro-3-deoxy-phosphogluconate aldolase [Verrucomicrobia bacterium]|nr:MAG: bifunctional 4-hydroxy-2-oxoglutarate aldolase/2-dehydro-3-deoxy-phosphogluconate aldolase [Verrucomicrobiota bacterium]
MQHTGVIAVLVVDRAEDAVPLARALLAGGVDLMELTLRTPVAIEALRRIVGEVPEMLAGMGTVITPAQVRDVAAAGAVFGVAPGTNPRVIRAATEAGLPFAPGVVTPSDVEQALECACRLLKFFPAESSGGLNYLKYMAAPFLHLNVRFIPLGGLDMTNIEKYLREPIIQAVGGSWIAPRELIKQQAWSRITENARQATQLVQRIHSGSAQ